MPLIRCITGTESFRSGSASFTVTIPAQRDFPGLPVPRGIFISEAAKQTLHVSAQSRPSFLPSSRTGLREQGNYFDGTFVVPEGMILRLNGVRRPRFQGQAMPVKHGLVLIRARDDGPLNRVTFTRIEDDLSTNTPVFVEGRFDVISIRDAVTAGVSIEADDLGNSRPAAVSSVMTKAVVQPARTGAVKVRAETITNNEGEQVRVVSKRVARPLKL